MALPRALIELAVQGATESQRRIESVSDALRRMNGESLDRISGQMNSLGDRYSNLQSTFGKVAGFAVAGVSLASLATRITGIMDSMAELDDLSQKIGTSVERLSQIQKVAAAFGADFAGSIDPALVKLAKGLTTVDEKSSKTGKALAALGISANTLSDPGEIMVEVAKSLQQYEDGSAKAAIVNDLFGKSAADLLPFLNDLSQTVDGFSTISAESVTQVAELQDQFGMLGVRTSEAFEAVTAAALPALSGLAKGFADAIEAKDGLIDGGEIAEWASMAAMGIARVADVGLLAVRTFSAISSSVQVVAADLKVLWTASPARMAYSAANGGSPLEELKKTVAERNQVLDDANKKLSDFYNARGDVFSSKVASYLAPKVGDVAQGSPSTTPGKKTLAYKSSGDDADKDAEKLANAYQNLVKAIQAKIVQADLELSAGAPLVASQQEQLRLTEQLAEMKGKLTPIQYALLESDGKDLITKLEVIEANKRAAEGLESYTKSMEAYDTSIAKAIENAQSEAAQNEALALTFGKTKGEIAALELAQLEYQKTQASSTGLTLGQIDSLDKLIEAKKRSATALGTIDGLEASKKSVEELNAFLDPTKAQSFGDALKGAFGAAGDSMTQMVSALDAYGIRQAGVDKARQLAAVAYAKDSKGFAAATAAISADEVKSRLSGYGDMTAAAKGFFGESSKGYDLLSGAEKAFRAFELASQMESLYTHLFVTTAKATGTTAGQAVETTAVVAGEAARNTAKVPGVFMSFMSALGPWGMAAAGVAIAAVLGGAFSGGGSVSLSESRQKTQGTGTVLGSDEQSESISNSLELIESATSKGLNISTGMLTALRNIEANIGQFASFLVQSTGVSGEFGSSLATKDGNFFSKLGSSIFGGKKTVEDTGFMLNSASLSSILNGGVNASQYADIKKSGGWFSSSKMSTQVEGLGAEGNRQITSVLTSLYGSVVEAGKLLGVGGDDFTNRLSGFVVDIGKVSLKGLSGAEIEEQLSAVFSKVGDQLASFGVAGIAQFQQIGEGTLETLTRVAANYASLDAVLSSVGKTFGATGLASIGARESLLTLAGGIDELASQTASFAENFLTEAERLAPVQKYVTDQLSSMGLSALRSRDSFKQYVLGLDLTNVAQREQYVALMDLQEAYAQLYPEIEDATLTLAGARTALTDAYNAENDAIGATVDRMFSLSASLKSLRENAVLGALSPLSPQEKYAEAKAQYESVLAAARGGDESAQSNYSAAFNSFLTASRAVFASSAQYQADFAYAQASTAETERWASAQVDVGKAQLDALKLSVSSLITLDKSVLSVRDAILQMHQVMGITAPPAPATMSAPQVFMPTPVMYASYGADNTVALVAELKSVRQELASLRAEQAVQTGHLIQANAKASSDSADVIAAATKSAAKATNEKRVSPA
jgi:hypothetical protein